MCEIGENIRYMNSFSIWKQFVVYNFKKISVAKFYNSIFKFKVPDFNFHSVEISLFFCHSDFTWNQFYVKPNCESCKTAVFAILEAGTLSLCQISTFKMCKKSWKWKFRASQYVKMADFETLVSPTLISRKFLVTETVIPILATL